MPGLETIRRITVYAAEGLEKPLVASFIQLGAKGYTITECRGLGEHKAVDDPLAKSTHVRIELLVNPQVGEKIMEYLRKQDDRHLAVSACEESVLVNNASRF